MKRFRSYILPRLLLALSSLALLVSIFSLWLSMNAPLPSAAAICARLDRERYVSGSALIASGPIRYQDPALPGTPRNTWWFVGKNSGTFQFYTLEKMWGFLWRSTDQSVRQAEFSPDSPAIFAQPMGTLFLGTDGVEFTLVVVSTDPSVVRVEARLAHMGIEEREDPQSVMDSRGVSPEFTQVSEGVWAAQGVVVPPSGERYSSLVIWCRGYDANGALICANPAQPLE